MNFMTQCAQGKVSPDLIDVWIDAWHEDDTEAPLYEYLGMTHEEYADWVSLKRTVSQILQDRLHPRPRKPSLFYRALVWLTWRLLGLPR